LICITHTTPTLHTLQLSPILGTPQSSFSPLPYQQVVLRKISSTINLHSPKDYTQTLPEVGGSFQVDAHTYYSPLQLQFPHAPVNHTLELDASTRFSNIHVNLHPNYEGTFDVNNKVGPPELILRWDEGDSEGLGRQRKAIGSEEEGGRPRLINQPWMFLFPRSIVGEVWWWLPSEGCRDRNRWRDKGKKDCWMEGQDAKRGREGSAKVSTSFSRATLLV
jgi:hypothetical protein